MTEEEKRRYSRLIAIDGIGSEGIERLSRATVLIVGCGALGSMAAMQLAAAGVGHLRIVDFDTIDISNLQRQFFYSTSETGKKKAWVLANRIKDLNPCVEVKAYDDMFSVGNASWLLEGCDFVVEATDNPASMTLIDKICSDAGIAYVLAGVSGFSGQVCTCLPGHRRYSDIFPDISESGFLPCSMGGVSGQAAAVAASIQVAETIKALIGFGSLLSDSILVFDLLDLHFDIIHT